MKIETRKDAFTEKIHGIIVPDPYRWLEGDPNSPEIHSWLVAQAAAATTYFEASPIRNTVRDELKALNEYTSQGLPIPKNGRYFYTRREPKQDMALLYVREGLRGEERLLLDPHTFSPDSTAVLSGWSPSRDGKLLVYGISKSANDKKELRVLNVDTGETLPDLIPDDIYPYMEGWNLEGSGFRYIRRDPEAPATEPKYHKRVYFHKIGTDVSTDSYVWGNGFAREWLPSVTLSHDGKYFLGQIRGEEKGERWNEIYVKEADSEKDFTLVARRVLGAEFSGHIHRDKLYMMTNDGAARWKIIATPLADALGGAPKFRDVLQEGEDTLEHYKIVGDRLFALYMRDVRSVLLEHTLEGKLLREIPLPTLGSVGGVSGEAEGDELFYLFTSFAFPAAVYRLRLTSEQADLFFQAKATFDVNEIETHQVWFTSKDGTKIPMFLVHKKGLKKDGMHPTMLYGYGGFEISLRPGLTLGPIPLIRRGGIYAIANLRGGGEYGRPWHEAGTKKQKQNTFNDFIAAAEFLCRDGYTSKDKLAIMGGSNGGLLVSAVEAQRPDLVKAVVCRVPVADMLRYHLHHGGRHWIPDYGSPDDPEMFRYLFGYSPYHNLRDGEKYPATLIMTSDGDDRVHPLHAYKLAARLQEANASGAPILMRVEMKAGHGGASAITRYVEQEADMWSFVFKELGVV